MVPDKEEGVRHDVAPAVHGLPTHLLIGPMMDLDKASQLARLYAGVQPVSAEALGQLAGLPVTSGTANLGAAAPATGSALYSMSALADSAGQGAQGFGRLLYKGLQGIQNRGQSSSSGGKQK